MNTCATDVFINELISRADKLQWKQLPQWVCEFVTEISSPKIGELRHVSPEDINKPYTEQKIYKISVSLWVGMGQNIRLTVGDEILETQSYNCSRIFKPLYSADEETSLTKLFNKIKAIVDADREIRVLNYLNPVMEVLEIKKV